MNRRTMLASLAIALTMPATALAEAASPGCGTAVRAFQLPPATESGRGSLKVTVHRQGGLVAPLPTVDEIMTPVIEAGHEHAGIEFHIVDQTILTPPPGLGLKSIFVTWTSYEGAAAVRRNGGIAVLQDGETRWTVAANHDDVWPADLLVDVAMLVSSLNAEAAPRLLDLLPTEDALPPGWELATERVTPEPCGR